MTVAMLRRATVLERSAPMGSAVELVLHEPEAATMTKPGQFFQLGVEAQHTLLRRPYSIAWTDPDLGRIGFIFSVVGAGSAWLGRREAGQPIELLGPLGNGFAIPGRDRTVVCIAGGLGIAAFVGLVQRLNQLGRRVVVLLGARSSDRLLPSRRLAGAEVRVATDDGSAGKAGPVTALLPATLRDDAELFMCGPTEMLRAVVRSSRELGFPLERVQVALETPMGCGIGTCLGCALPARAGGYLLACHDGPCVRADQVDWDRMDGTRHGG